MTKFVKKDITGAKVTVRQVKSAARRNIKQTHILAGLGLTRIGKTNTLQDNACTRGMIAKVNHLIEVVQN